MVTAKDAIGRTLEYDMPIISQLPTTLINESIILSFPELLLSFAKRNSMIWGFFL